MSQEKKKRKKKEKEATVTVSSHPSEPGSKDFSDYKFVPATEFDSTKPIVVNTPFFPKVLKAKRSKRAQPVTPGTEPAKTIRFNPRLILEKLSELEARIKKLEEK